MPCLNEESNLASTIIKAQAFLKVNHINGEVIVADNGSTDILLKLLKKMELLSFL
jgi:glycosyltransferase involved in cell wall biosynthesis